MSDFQAIADRVEIEALRGEFTDAAMMRDATAAHRCSPATARCGCPSIGGARQDRLHADGRRRRRAGYF